MTRVPFVDFKGMHAPLSKRLHQTASNQIKSGDYILGKSVGEFETAYAKFCGTRFAIGVANGSDALQFSMLALGIGRGDEVILPAMSFAASAFAISHTGAKPVFVDIDPDHLCIDPSLIEKAVTKRTKAILPVDLYGLPAPMKEINSIAKRHGLHVIEDSCQAHGALYRGKRAGSLGITGSFSFYPAKNLGAFGDGGMVVTSNAAIAKKVRMLRHYGQPKRYQHKLVGFNSRLDTLQAGLLNVKLSSLDRWNKSRHDAADTYRELLAKASVRLQREPEGSRSIYHLFVVQSPRRKALQAHLKRCGIDSGIHYPQALHELDCYRSLGHRKGSFPHAERLAASCLSLPMFPGITKAQLRRVSDAVLSF
ncbi:MAG: hypothetical protein COB53_00330 [Elusimicrobia bacterium]|nr:MAG: hypothetical protein COB53_00330 [Elusimicrobiota bacterium]